MLYVGVYILGSNCSFSPGQIDWRSDIQLEIKRRVLVNASPRYAAFAEPDHAPTFMHCHCGRCAYRNADRAGGAAMVSGIVTFKDCVLVDNKARLGPAVYIAVTVTLESTDVCDNQLLCDEGSFLDWNHVSWFNLLTDSGGRGVHACVRAHPQRAMLSVARPGSELRTK